ncbi:MAG: potassium channel protein [Coriobacteriia bacterium]|nr:potassium channel protein [Coriobacteriia bacterium]
MAFGGLSAVLILGTVGYVVIEGWVWFDALYMTVITVGTVGFREVHTLSRAGEAFTMMLILAGFGALMFAFGTFVDFVVEGHLRGYLEGRRMESRIKNLTGHHIVAGLGRVGSVVARALADEGASFVVIEHSDDNAERAAEQGWPVVNADATEESTLLAAGIERAASLVTALDTDADNLFVTFTARSLNPDVFIVARSSHESSEEKLRRAGANRVMTPNVVGGRRMASMVLHPAVSDYLDLVTHSDSVEYRLQDIEVGAGSAFDGKSIREARVRDSTGAYVLAVQTPGGPANTNPSPDTVMRAGDRLVVLGTSAQIQAVMQSV